PRGSPLWPARALTRRFPERRGMNSCSPKRRPTAKMRASRNNLAKALDPLLEPRNGVAQARERFTERLEVGAAREDLFLLGRVVGDGCRQALRRVEMPRGECPARLRQAARGDIADQARQLLLRVPAQVTREDEYLGCELRVALDAHRAQRVIFAARERGEQLGLERHHQSRLRLSFRHGAPRKNPQA